MPSTDCEARINAHMEDRLSDLRTLWEAYCSGDEEVEDLGTIFEYGLSADYVAPGTFNDQDEGYVRYQLSTGGPGDEFRFYFLPVRYGYRAHRIEYWFLDWFDGAHRTLAGEDFDLMSEIFDWFDDGGSVQAWIDEATD